MHDILDPAAPDPSAAAMPPDCQFRIVGMRDGVVAVAGEIDEGVAAAFRAALLQPDVTAVDMALVTFIDSSGLRVLIEARAERTGDGGDLELRNPSRQVSRLLELTDLVGWFPVGSEGANPMA